ncbi:MAG: hypothetical protein EHM18_17020, partial [Acidobacteria bacterium]
MKRYFLLVAIRLLVPPLFYLAIPDVGAVGYAQTDAKPDLLVTNLTITPQQIAPGDTVTLSYEIVNMSDRVLPHAGIERYYLSRDSNLDASDRAFANSPYHGQSIPPVGRLAVTQQVIVPTWVLPRGMPDCYQLLVLADADNGIDEKSETNNVSSDFLCVLTRSDLVIRDLSVTPSRAKRGEALTLRYRIVNEGDTLAWTSGIERYYLSSDTLLDDGDSAFANSVYHGQPLPVGGSLDVVQTALVPQWASPGDQILLAQADATNLNLEANQRNNVGAAALYIGEFKPDLVIRDLSVTPTRAKRGDTLTLRYRIVNEGDTLAWTSGIERY